MYIKFEYSVQLADTGAQHHEREFVAQVDGEPGTYGEPSYQQLFEADLKFRQTFATDHPHDHLLKYEAFSTQGRDGGRAVYAQYEVRYATVR